MQRARMIGLAATAAVAALGLAGAAVSETAPSDVVMQDTAVTDSLTGQPGDPAEGRKWFADRKLGNCLACHANSDLSEQQFHGEIGPPLDGVADRWEEAQLRAILVDAKKVFGDQTIMPAFYRDGGYERPLDTFAGKTILQAQQVEDLVAYLLTLKE